MKRTILIVLTVALLLLPLACRSDENKTVTLQLHGSRRAHRDSASEAHAEAPSRTRASAPGVRSFGITA